jgi:hypothetical protein
MGRALEQADGEDAKSGRINVNQKCQTGRLASAQRSAGEPTERESAY